jgi:hypothetical protein|tara:strand:+ start:670 stop:975 length:306 start_codon:yes stop_codon:yes gene_type:complete
MRDIQHYYTEIHAKGFRHTNKFSGFDSVCAHFSTRARVGTMTFQQAKMDAVEYIAEQQVSRGWLDYTVGALFEQVGVEPVSVMCPSHSEGHRRHPVFKEVK